MLPDWANLLVSLLWTLAIINSLNLLDITDGLATGVALIAAGTFLAVSVIAGQFALAGLLAVICGTLIGVMLFNFPKASLFLGDSGSMLVGLLLASFALAISYAPEGREIALLTPILILGLPLFDLAFVVVVRARNGRSVIQKSQDHFVFRLIRSGLTPQRAVSAMFGLGLVFAGAALVISQVTNGLGLKILGLILVVSFWWAVRVSRVSVN